VADRELRRRRRRYQRDLRRAHEAGALKRAERASRRETPIPETLLPTSLVGSYPQPDWLIDRKKLTGRFPPRERAKELWRIAPKFLGALPKKALLHGHCHQKSFADAETLIVADCTSCRHQIHDGDARDALHVARVLAMSVEAGQAH
jgi:hypothetical protein